MAKSKHYAEIEAYVLTHPGCTMSDCAKHICFGTKSLPRGFYQTIKRACEDLVIMRRKENNRWRLYPYATPHTEEGVR